MNTSYSKKNNGELSRKGGNFLHVKVYKTFKLPIMSCRISQILVWHVKTKNFPKCKLVGEVMLMCAIINVFIWLR